MVEEALTAMQVTKSKDPGNHTSWQGWQKKRRIGRKKVSKALKAKVVRNLTAAWWFAGQSAGLNLNRFVTIRPRNIDEMTPEERNAFWKTMLNKVGQFARDHDFETAHIWSRESEVGTGRKEHLHVLVHVPPALTKRFEEVASSWFDGAEEIDIRPADYRHRWVKGKRRSAITYLTKNSPQAAYKTDLGWCRGGPILGKRAGCSRNIDAAVRARFEARQLIRCEFGHDRAILLDTR
jgi:hypothetical protein